MKALITKNTSEKMCKRLLDEQVDFAQIPFIEVCPSILNLSDFDFSKFSALIFTSQNAVDAFVCNSLMEYFLPRRIKIFAVGRKTVVSLQKIGFSVVNPPVDCADDLLPFLTFDEHYLFLKGNLALNTIPNYLKTNACSFSEIEVYQTKKVLQKVDMLQFDVIAFFSPSGVEAFFEKNILQSQKIVSIGKTTAEAVRKFGHSEIIVASQSTVEAVVEAIIALK